MLKNFFGINIYRFGDLSQMFFSQRDLAILLGMDKEMLNALLQSLRYSRAMSLPRGTKGRPRREVANVFTLETLLGCIFNRRKKTENMEKVIHWVCDILSNLTYDEFVSLYGFRSELKLRRAIISKVVGIKYSEIPLYRFDESDERYWGTIYRDQIKHFSPRVRNPDSYINRQEVTKVKALDLCIYLLQEYTSKTEEEILDFIGININDGEFTEEHKQEIKDYVDNLV